MSDRRRQAELWELPASKAARPQITPADQEVRVLRWPRLEAKPSTLSDTGTQTALKRSAKPMQGGRVAET